MRNRTVIGAVLSTALLLAAFVTPAAAQEKGATVGVGISFLNNDGETGTGITADVAKNVHTAGKAAIGVVGDLSYNKFDFGKLFMISGGVRVTGNVHEKVDLFGQFLVGMGRFSADDCDGDGCSDTDPVFTPGFGVNIKANEKIMVRAQLDFPIDKFEGGSETFKRFWFGVVFGLGK